MLYDDRGNVVAVMKISPDKLPSHRYLIGFILVFRQAGSQADVDRQST